MSALRFVRTLKVGRRGGSVEGPAQTFELITTHQQFGMELQESIKETGGKTYLMNTDFGHRRKVQREPRTLKRSPIPPTKEINTCQKSEVLRPQLKR